MQLYANKVKNNNSNNNLVQSEQHTVQPTDELWSRGELLEFLDYFQFQDNKLSGSPAQNTQWTRLNLTIITFLGVSFLNCAELLYLVLYVSFVHVCIPEQSLVSHAPD